MSRNIYYTSSLYPTFFIAMTMGVRTEDLFIVAPEDEDDGVKHPNFQVLLDHESKCVVLVVRGTSITRKGILNDVLIDLAASDEKFLYGHAHQGILDGALKVLQLTKEKLAQLLEKFPTYDLVLTGHSLGAGTVVLIALELLHDENCFVDKSRIECVAFAPPPVFRSDDPVADDALDKILIFILGMDMVPSASLGTFDKLLIDLEAVDQSLTHGGSADDYKVTSGQYYKKYNAQGYRRC